MSTTITIYNRNDDKSGDAEISSFLYELNSPYSFISEFIEMLVNLDSSNAFDTMCTCICRVDGVKMETLKSWLVEHRTDKWEYDAVLATIEECKSENIIAFIMW